MANRSVVRRLSDLIPDILIEAQRCDAITARKALERAAEDLAYNHGFFRTTYTFTISETTTEEEYHGKPCYVFYVDDTEVLGVEKIEALGDGSTRVIDGYTVGAEGRVYVDKRAIPGSTDRLRFTCSILPTVDEDVSESTAMTRGRRVILSLALYDVFGMPGQIWSNPDRASFWMRAFTEALETWNYNERFREQTGGIQLTRNPYA